MIRRLTALAAVVAVSLGLFGCNYKEHVQQSDADYGSRATGDPKAVGMKAYGDATGDANQHNNTFFEYSSLLSKKTSALGGIASAIVMLTDKNVYVALMLDWTAVGTSNVGTREQNNTGVGEGVYNADNGSPYGNGRVLASPYNSYFTVGDHHLLSHELKQTVGKLIREQVPAVEEVHISANMEFINYFNEFAKEAWGSRPLTPWIDLFNTVVRYHFAGGTDRPKPITVPEQQ